LMLSKLHRAAHKADVNWAPLSNVMVAGTLNLDPASEKGPCTVCYGVEGSGIASSHWDVLWITMNV
jgi:hypothetical protein